jgi:hypothetical protein
MDGLLMVVNVMLYITSCFSVKACHKMTKCSTIQKLDRYFSAASFAASLKPHPLQDGSSSKRWHVRALLQFTIMHCEYVIKGKLTEPALLIRKRAVSVRLITCSKVFLSVYWQIT